MRVISLNQPKELVFGNHCFENFLSYFSQSPYKRVLVVADFNVQLFVDKLTAALHFVGKQTYVVDFIKSEPTLTEFELVKKIAEENEIDAVIGLGGGSVLDVAKLVATLCYIDTPTSYFFDANTITGRKLFLACLPTTAGTGSEVSPNAILLDEKDNLKKGIVSSHLIPDVTYIDPVLTYTVPSFVTAATGLDAFVHCIEAYANKNSHPIIDLYALQGIQLIYNNLERAYLNGKDEEARANVALGSMYGGLCLGPVNTAAIHALAYPLGSMFKIPHGVANAMLLPHVLRVNIASSAERYAAIARSIGCEKAPTAIEMATEAIHKIEELCKRVQIPEKLTAYKVTKDDVPIMADSAMTIQRLLKNNLHELTRQEIIDIYYKLL
jgi:alcohol dehydrogenase class IV